MKVEMLVRDRVLLQMVHESMSAAAASEVRGARPLDAMAPDLCRELEPTRERLCGSVTSALLHPQIRDAVSQDRGGSIRRSLLDRWRRVVNATLVSCPCPKRLTMLSTGKLRRDPESTDPGDSL